MARFFVTTPIYYVNDAPHVGHAYTTVVADALARWRRMAGEEVLFLTGTDEHGLKVAQSAAAAGVSPKEWADTTSARFRAAWDVLDVAPDDFIRTTEERHVATVQAFLGAIRDNGYIELGTYEGWYCVACEAYYAEAEIAEGACPVHGLPLERMQEENYFFRLSAFEDRLLEHYAAHPRFVRPEAKRNEALGFIRSGLQDISITRTSIDWGIPVPWDSRHVVYVWADALVNYVTAAGYGSDPARFATWWPASHHLIGKEILRFHCVWWPAMCMAAGIDPPQEVFVHGWLLVGGEKMSKTGLNQLFPADLVDDFGVDAVRYHLLRDVTLGADGDFSYEGMVARYNADLANNLGNLLARVTTLVETKCGGVGPGPSGGAGRVAEAAVSSVEHATAAWRDFAPAVALEQTWGLIREANAQLEATEPRKMAAGPALDAVLGDALEALRLVTLLVAPAMPRAATVVWERLGLAGSPLEAGGASRLRWGGYPGGLSVTKGPALFPRRRA